MIWKFTDNKSRDSIEQQFDWARNMNEVPQDKLYHAEGNVAVHTWKVIEELQQLPAYSDLGGQDKEILWTAALLHDVEKRSATVVESDGRITARGHARKGEYTVRTLLYRDLPTPFAIREKIASLVRFHGLPLWLMEKTDPVRKIAEVAFRLDTSQLRMLGRKAGSLLPTMPVSVISIRQKAISTTSHMRSLNATLSCCPACPEWEKTIISKRLERIYLLSVWMTSDGRIS